MGFDILRVIAQIARVIAQANTNDRRGRTVHDAFQTSGAFFVINFCPTKHLQRIIRANYHAKGTSDTVFCDFHQSAIFSLIRVFLFFIHAFTTSFLMIYHFRLYHSEFCQSFRQVNICNIIQTVFRECLLF